MSKFVEWKWFFYNWILIVREIWFPYQFMKGRSTGADFLVRDLKINFAYNFWVCLCFLIFALPLLVISIFIVIIAEKGDINIEQLDIWVLYVMIVSLIYFTISNRDEEIWHNKSMHGRELQKIGQRPCRRSMSSTQLWIRSTKKFRIW